MKNPPEAAPRGYILCFRLALRTAYPGREFRGHGKDNSTCQKAFCLLAFVMGRTRTAASGDLVQASNFLLIPKRC